MVARRYVSKLDPSPAEQLSDSVARACQLEDAPSPSSATEPFFAVKESSSTLDASAPGEGSKGALDGGNFTSHTERKLSFEGRMAASEYSVTE